MKADLHNHSTYSDGRLGIRELDELAQSKQLDIIAITDHDNIQAYNDIKENKLKTKILLGIELSSDMNGEDVHILGYFRNNEEPTLKFIKFLEEKSRKRKDRVCEIIRRLKKYYDIEITYDEIASFADGVIGRPHVAWAIEKKYGIPFNKVFEKYIGDTKKAYIPTDNFSTKEAIELLKENNALVVLAHPKLIKKNSIEDIVKLGIEGIEVRYPFHSELDEKNYLSIAKKYNLIVTGGSDFHGSTITSEMGTSFISDLDLEKFMEKIYQ